MNESDHWFTVSEIEAIIDPPYESTFQPRAEYNKGFADNGAYDHYGDPDYDGQLPHPYRPYLVEVLTHGTYGKPDESQQSQIAS